MAGIYFNLPDSSLGFDDDFTGNNGDAPNTDRWDIIGDSNDVFIQDNKLRTQVAGSGKNNGIESKFKVSGDFIIQVDFNVAEGYSSGSGWVPFLIIRHVDDSTNLMRIYLDSIIDDVFVMQYWTNGSYRGASFGTAKASSGTFKISRSGILWQASIDKGSGFTNIGSAKNIESVDVDIQMRTEVWGSVTSAKVDFDNFTIVEGTASLI